MLLAISVAPLSTPPLLFTESLHHQSCCSPSPCSIFSTIAASSAVPPAFHLATANRVDPALGTSPRANHREALDDAERPRHRYHRESGPNSWDRSRRYEAYEIQRLGLERPQAEEDLYNPFELDERNEDEDRIVSEKRDYYCSELVVADVGRCCVMLAGAGSLNNNDENISSCNGLSGDCLSYSDDEDENDINVNDNEDDGAVRYISYEPLKTNIIPCGERGNSYSNCGRSRQANPYTRGGSYITHCAFQ
ncbi:hypothetical protein M0R45_009466 [Rubus argutus]|uniref:Uncharacterized protein n=1 Tax=Rubus argutus TaxID=59490 RepID=A0AAW1Y6M5_RUBAR